MESINKGAQMFIEAEQYAWGLAEHESGPELISPIMSERIRKGVKVKMLIPESFLPTAIPLAKAQNYKVRGLSDIPAIMAVTEKEAAVCFRFIGGRVDYAGFYGKDPILLNWVRDLFLFYWDKGKRT